MDEQTPAASSEQPSEQPVAQSVPTTTPAASTSGAKPRGGCLTAWLILGFIGGIGATISYLTNGQMMQAAYPTWPIWAGWVYALLSLGQLGAIYGIWQWQKWGLNLYYGLIPVYIILSFLVGGIPMLIAAAFGGAIGAGIMYWLTNSVKDQFV